MSQLYHTTYIYPQPSGGVLANFVELRIKVSIMHLALQVKKKMGNE